MVERFTRIDLDTIDYRFTAHDPSTFATSWSAAIPLAKMDSLIYEYASHEGNYSMLNMLRGARAEEKAAGEAVDKK